MIRNAILLGICIGSAASIPILYRTNPLAVEALFVAARGAATGDAADYRAGISVSQTVAPPPGRRVHLPADDRGHFIGEFKINGRRVEALVDTGATALAINLSTARRLGIRIALSDLKENVNTANGKARATIVMVDRVEIGRIAVDDVQAIVLSDDALSTTLVGMTFLNRLRKFQVDGQGMTLVQ